MKVRLPSKIPVRLVRVGDYRGIRIPTWVIRRLELDRPGLEAEVRSDGLFLPAAPSNKLSWSDTAWAMAVAKEDWSDLEIATLTKR
jgi:hypothetical protein